MDNKNLDVSKEVESLIKKAEEARTADDALKFSQAACNSANAMGALAGAKAEIARLRVSGLEPMSNHGLHAESSDSWKLGFPPALVQR